MSFEFLPLRVGAAGLAANQRATVRYRCAPATPGCVLFANDHEFQRAWVLDLSTNGVGLSMSRPIAPGTLVLVQMTAADTSKIYRVPVRVAHSTPTHLGDFLVGCEFITAISNEDLDSLL